MDIPTAKIMYDLQESKNQKISTLKNKTDNLNIE
jgi:hypothetical protein